MLRTIVEENVVADALRAVQKVNNLIGEAFEALKWLIARNPLRGTLIEDGFYMHKQQGNNHLPNITILYSFDGNQVCILILGLSPTLGQKYLCSN